MSLAPLTDADAEKMMQNIRLRTRKAEAARRTVPPVLTVDGVAEVRRMLAACARHASPDAVTVILLLEKAIDAELAKASQARQRGRAELTVGLFLDYYKPKGYSARRAAAEIRTIGKDIIPLDLYPSDPHHSVQRIIALNGSKLPSFGTIKRDLERL